ncbi:hypothetical protein D3C81_1633390 [compost metagenome]
MPANIELQFTQGMLDGLGGGLDAVAKITPVPEHGRVSSHCLQVCKEHNGLRIALWP